ncbi:Structural maintenance of chromosomes protein 5 [Scheffersomyces spartinae]|uniref:Structural maintenance of chromosomes protein 5 n=1 Tax=Scheffersomyces spartinae TaxID=45513 RepID=A0A9P7V698_9ASCO|nr:Structural maintenance of chromosomes protein 5 [Scheffersomyces spartinae]KAG7192157.1 Structural maintenance of chromosomes protein 5 [Scheffersomyces spartinae]
MEILGDLRSYVDSDIPNGIEGNGHAHALNGHVSNGKRKLSNLDVSSAFITKRKRTTSSGFEQYKAGLIIKVIITDFTTYSYGEFKLGPRLNMIVGPNGTGKSTLVAAICLGLGGKLELIKRKTMKSMIRNGKTRGTIEITLKAANDNDSVVTIKRSFTEKDSEYTINGELQSETKVRQLVKSLNVQLDNLCHFLPQERVAEFATLSADKLLRETERTMKNGELLQMHENLIRIDTQVRELSKEIDEDKAKLLKLKEEGEALQEEAKKYTDFQEKTKELEVHKLLIPYAILQDMKKTSKELKQRKKDAQNKLNQFGTSAIGPIIEQEDTLKSAKLEHFKALTKQQTKLEALNQSLIKLSSEESDYDKRLVELEERKVELQSRGQSAAKRLVEVKRQRDDCKSKLESLEEIDPNKRTQLREEINKRDLELTDIEAQLNSLRFEKQEPQKTLKSVGIELTKLQNQLHSKDRLPQLAHSKLRACYQVHSKLRQISNKNWNYYEAPILSCQVSSKLYARYIEKVVDNNSLQAVVFDNSLDFEKGSSMIQRISNFPRRLVGKVSSLNQTAALPSLEMVKNFGFDGYLSDFINGPEPVIRMLKENAKLDQIPATTKKLSEAQLNRLTEPDVNGKIPFMKFITGDTLYTMKRSFYGRRQLFYTTEVIPSKADLLQPGISDDVRDRINRQIELLTRRKDEANDAIKEVSTRMQSLEQELLMTKKDRDQLRIEEESVQQLIRKRNTLSSRIKILEEEIDKLKEQAESSDLEQIKIVNNKIVQSKIKLQRKRLEKANITKQVMEEGISVHRSRLLLYKFENQIEALQQMRVEVEKLKVDLQHEYDEAKRKFDSLGMKEKIAEIRKERESYTEEQLQRIDELAQQYVANQTLTENYLRDRIKTFEDQRRLLSTADQNSIRTLKEKLREIELLNRSIPAKQSAETELKDQISLIRNQWEPQLEELVNGISLAFNERFTKVAIDGKVVLTKEDKYKDWSLDILVRFRQEADLKRLDNRSQSGGERAISTIIFMMSLHGLTDAPFRIVDEINQGMDANNERMAHKFLVETCSGAISSQYILVTPKLLTNLYYDEDMRVHCVYSGKFLQPPERHSSTIDFMDFANWKI